MIEVGSGNCNSRSRFGRPSFPWLLPESAAFCGAPKQVCRSVRAADCTGRCQRLESFKIDNGAAAT